MNAIVTVIGKDRVGITASVCTLLAKYNINLLNISMSVLREEYFTMVMLVDISKCTTTLPVMSAVLSQAGEAENLTIQIQREEIFNAMHRI